MNRFWKKLWASRGGQAAPARQDRRRRRSMQLEKLEGREQPAGLFPALDGAGHNDQHADWGSTGEDLLRRAPAAYADGISTPAGANRPSARAVSNAINAQPADTPLNDRDLSNFVYAWGQFIDHDLDLTTSASPRQAFNISVPAGDPYFDPTGTGTVLIPLGRSNFDPTTGTSVANPRQQVNDITAWLDGSMIYGVDAARGAALRTFSGGQLKTSDGGLLPLNTAGFANANDTHQTPDDQLFLAGDVRANENIELTAIHALFVREHNRIAGQLSQKNPTLGDEELYQRARLTVIGELQAITYNEFLPALLGAGALPRYAGYKPNVNPGITNEFSTAAFRVGHTLVGDDVEFLDDQGNEIRPALELSEAFFNPNVLKQTGIDPVLKYLASDNSEEVDVKVVDSLRNFLFGPPGAGGLDLAALNIQRGRDHGLADYNTVRAAYGLPRVTSFAQITPDKQLQDALQAQYGNVNNIDLWIGGLAEQHLPGASVGATFSRIIADQFARLRDGDQFWYERVFRGPELDQVRRTTLADVIRRNTELRNVQDNVFVFSASISGRVFNDVNRDGRWQGPEVGVAGRTLELLDAGGNVVATAVSRRDGTYRFEHVGLGTYSVRELPPPNVISTTPAVKPIKIVQGGDVRGIDFGEALASVQAAPRPRRGVV